METSNDKNAHTQKLRNITALIYVLQVVAFFLHFAPLVGIFINYLKKEEVKGTWLESHFSWQIKTFWVAALIFVVFSSLVMFFQNQDPNSAFAFVLLPILIIPWLLYRSIKGGLALYENRDAPKI